MQQNEADLKAEANPDGLTYEEILDLIKVCLICGNPWSKRKHTCAKKNCLVKMRVEPRVVLIGKRSVKMIACCLPFGSKANVERFKKCVKTVRSKAQESTSGAVL